MPKGKKWRGKSVNRVLDPLSEVSEIGRALFLMEKMSRNRIAELTLEAKLKMIELADELTYVPIDHISLGGWKCEKSITDHCVYNIGKDPHRDNCLFCGEPSDRG